MTKERQNLRGACHACGAAGPDGRQKDFLCGACADQDAVMVICARCENRVRFDTDAGIALLTEHFPDQSGIARGSVLRVDCCASCTDILPARLTVRHYAIA